MSHQEVNRQLWDSTADRWVESAEVDWASPDPAWGMWRVPEAEVQALPDLDGLDAIELGCGTAYFSAWLARRGARPGGVDQSKRQLATARAMQRQHGIEFPLIEADAEDVPLPDASFDLALSEYGASLWCEPARWIAEAARLLRPAAGSSSSPARRCWFSARRPRPSWRPSASPGPSSGSTASSGTTPTARRSSSTSRTAR